MARALQKYLFKSLGLVLLFPLSSCVKVFPDPAPAPKYILLRPEIKVNPALKPVSWSLKIDKPQASASLDSPQISIVHTGGPLRTRDFIAGVAWNDRLTLMVQDQVLESLSHTGMLKALGRGQEHFKADYQLQVGISHFEMEVNSSKEAQARIEILGRLIRSSDHRVVEQRIFSSSVKAGSHSLPEFVKAFETAWTQVLGKMVVWVVKI